MSRTNPIAADAATILANRRRTGEQGPRLPETLRPRDIDAALAIQSCVTEQLGEDIGGWKCGVPAEGRIIVAPIHAGTIHAASPCPVRLDAGKAHVEPEFAFILGRDLPARNAPYTPADVDAAIARTHLALELIGSRYADAGEAGFTEHLADGLLNQGLLIGPETSTAAPGRMKIHIRLEDGQDIALDGQHPNAAPRAPLYWLAEFLRSRGQGLRAGQAVITGSYAGSFELPAGQEIEIQFGDLGRFPVYFTPK